MVFVALGTAQTWECVPMLSMKYSPVPSFLISQWPKQSKLTNVKMVMFFNFLNCYWMLFSDFLLDWNSGELERNLWLCTSACGTAGSVLLFTGVDVHGEYFGEIFPIWRYFSNIIWVFNFKAIRNRCSIFFQIPLILFGLIR